jgi:hypothetical protein
MTEIVVDTWAVIACTDRALAAEDAAAARDRIDRELVMTVTRLNAALGSNVSVRVEQ